jgi:hypothetical protein
MPGRMAIRRHAQEKIDRIDLAVVWWRLIHLKRINNFLCSMLVYAPFALCFVTLRGIFMRFLELTY